MPWAAYRHLRDKDLRDMHAFLRTVQPVAHYVGNVGRPTRCPVCLQEHPLGEGNQVERPAGIALDARVTADLVGTYRSEEYGFTLVVTREGDRLFARWEDLPMAELIPQSETGFAMVGGLAPLRFERDREGRITRAVSEEVEELVLTRLP